MKESLRSPERKERGRTSRDGSPAERQSRRFRLAPRTAGLLTRLAFRRASTLGNPGALLKRVGLSQRQVQDPDALLSARKQVEFVEVTAEAMRDDLFGFHLAENYDLREAGLFYYVLASSESLMSVLQRGARYTSVVNEGVTQTCIDGNEIGLRLRYSHLSRHRDRHQVEFWSASMLRICRHLTGVSIVPAHVRLAHRSRGRNTEVARFYGCNVEYEAGADEITFTRKVRDLPLLNADPHLNRLLRKYGDAALSSKKKAVSSLREQAENEIVPLLPHGEAQIERVAQRLGLSERSLSRHLAFEGTSFSSILQELRLHLAREYLQEEEVSISQVAWLLGYQDATAFSRAFRQWTGSAPGRMPGRRRSTL
jgi:AraC-like DNA-binding protein